MLLLFMFCFVVVVFGFWFRIITNDTDNGTIVRCVLTCPTLDPYFSVTLFSTTHPSPCILAQLRIILCIEIASGITRVYIVSTMTTQAHL